MEKTINHTLGKKEMSKLIKQRISGKMAVVKDEDGYLKLGTPPFMTFDVKITDTTMHVASKGLADPLAQTCISEVEMALEDMSSGSAPAESKKTSQKAPQMSSDEYLEYQKNPLNF